MWPTTLVYLLCPISNYAAPHQGISYAQVSIKIRWMKTHIGLDFKKEMKMDFFFYIIESPAIPEAGWNGSKDEGDMERNGSPSPQSEGESEISTKWIVFVVLQTSQLEFENNQLLKQCQDAYNLKSERMSPPLFFISPMIASHKSTLWYNLQKEIP